MIEFIKKAIRKSSGGILVYVIVALLFIFGPLILDGEFDKYTTVAGLSMLIVAVSLSIIHYR